jgi:cytidylate kinase
MAVGSYEKCKRYLESHFPAEKPSAKKNVYPCITISRETGAGAQTVCEELIKILETVSGTEDNHWTFFDRELIEKILDDHNLPKQISEYLKEDKYRHLSSAVNELLGLHPTQWTLIHKTTETVLQLARMGKVVIVGRGATIITSKLSNTFHVRLIAPLENKIRYVMHLLNLNRIDAETFIKKEDSARKKYVASNFSKDIADQELYHLIINTGLLSHKEAAHVIADAVMKKFVKLYAASKNQMEP